MPISNPVYPLFGNLASGLLQIGNGSSAQRAITLAPNGATNLLQLVDGTPSLTTPTLGGYFYSAAGQIHWVDSTGTDTILTGAASSILGANNTFTGSNRFTQKTAFGNPPDVMVVNGVVVTSQIVADSNTFAVIESHSHNATAGLTGAGILYGARSRGTNVAPTIVNNGDYISAIAGVGFDGVGYGLAGYSAFIVDGAPGVGVMPGAWSLALSPSGTETPVEAIRVTNQRNVTLQMPASGSALTINAVSTGVGITVSGGGVGGALISTQNTLSTNTSSLISALNDTSVRTSLQTFGSAAAAYGAWGTGEGGIYTTAPALNIMADNVAGIVRIASGGNTTRITVAAAGNVTLALPTSGQTLTLAPSPAAGELIATSAALTTGAGVATGTLTNAPSAGNPTKWIKINDNGTIRSVPAW